MLKVRHSKRLNWNPRLRGSLAIALAAFLCANPAAYGATITWNGLGVTGGSTSSSWKKASNWTGGLPGSTSDVTIDSGTVMLDTNSSIDSLALDSLSVLTINSGKTLTVGSPSSSGSVLQNFGTIEVKNTGKLNVDATAFGPLNYGTLTLDAGSTTTLTNSGTNTAYAYNLGTVDMGSLTAGGATLQLSNTSGLSTSTFVLAPDTTTISLANNSANSITGVMGNEILMNETVIEGAGTISHLNSVNNDNGVLWASGSRGLTVSAPLTNWSSGTLTNGTYQADNTLTLSSIGSGTIGTLNGATVTVTGIGMVSGNGTTNALAGLSNITGSTLNLTNLDLPTTITPTSGTLNVAASDLAAQNAALNVSASTLTIAGALTNTSGSVQTSTISVANAGTLYASGLTNNGIVAVDNTSTADFSSGANGSFTNLSGGVLNGGTYQIAGNFMYAPSTAGVGGGDILTIGATANVSIQGTGSMTYGGVNGLTNLTTNNGTLTVTQDSSAIPGSLALSGSLAQNGTLNVMGGSTLTTGGLNNSGTIYIDGTSTADFSGGAFANIDGSGKLSGGTYTIAGNFTYAASSGDIKTIGANTSVELDGAVANMSYVSGGNTINGLANLASNQGTLTLGADSGLGASLTVNGAFSQTGGSLILNGSSFAAGGAFSQDAASQTVLTNSSSLTATGLNNQGFLNIDASSGASFQGGTFSNLSGGTLTGGSYKIGGQLLYDGGDITSIAAGTRLELDGMGQMAYGPSTGPTNGILNLATNSGTLVLDQDSNSSSASLTLNGGLSQVGGTLQLNNNSTLTLQGAFTQDASSSTQVLSGSALIAQGLNNSGILHIDSESSASFATGTSTGTFANLANNGTLTGGTYQIAGSFMYDPYAASSGSNAGGDILKIASGTSVEIDGAGSMTYSSTDNSYQNVNGLANLETNSGTLIVGIDDAGNPGTLSVNGNLAQVGGALQITGGSTLSVGGQFSQDAASTTYIDAVSTLQVGTGFVNQGTLTGSGTVMGDLTNEGVDDPGGTGTQTIDGNFDQTRAGMLDIDVQGDGLNSSLSVDGVDGVDGNVTLDGTIQVDFDGYSPTSGDEFILLTWTGTLLADSATFDLAPLASGLHYEEVVSGNQLTLEVLAPEPSTLGLMLAMLPVLAVAWHLRRRRSCL
jgi:hypothetical protein